MDSNDKIYVLTNLIWFGAFFYVIFFMGYSGWWFLFPILFPFARIKYNK